MYIILKKEGRAGQAMKMKVQQKCKNNKERKRNGNVLGSSSR